MFRQSRRVFISAMGAAAVAVALASCAAGNPTGPNGEPTESLKIVTASGEHSFWVEIADTEAERARGLMFRPPLADDRGMLFTWPGEAPREQSFWMRNTPSSLDIIYLDPTGRIVSIATHTTPFSDLPVPSNGPANGALELRAGRSAEIGAKPGDRVIHSYFKQ